MPISVANKPQLTGIIILFTGVALLAFTFITAFMFLQEPFGIIASGDLSRVFGEALAPLIQACIRLMYLGIMGWIGSLLTIRGIPLVTHKYIPVISPIATQQAKPQPQPKKQPQSIPTPQTSTSQIKSQPQQAQQISTTPQPSQLKPRTNQEQPEAILIPPENQREE